MGTTITIKLDDEHTRRVVTFALWRIASSDVVGGHELSDGFYNRAWWGIHPAYMPEQNLGESEHRMVRLAQVRMAVRAVATAGDGERRELPISAQELDGALNDLLIAMDQNSELLWTLSDAEREDVARCQDAALRLLRVVAPRSEITAGEPAGEPAAATIAPEQASGEAIHPDYAFGRV